MRLTPLFILLFLAIAAYGQMQQRVAVINTLDDGEPPIKILELGYLTDKLRETASNVLPKSQYGVMTTESIVAFLGSEERLIKVCKESSCLAELGRKVSADYVSQARIGRFGNDLTIKTELYEVKSGTLVGSFTGYSKDIYGLSTLIDEKAPGLFKKLLNSPSGSSAPTPAAVFAAPQREIAPPPPSFSPPTVAPSFSPPTVAPAVPPMVYQEEQYNNYDEPYEPPEEIPLEYMAAANRKQLEHNTFSVGLRAGLNYSKFCVDGYCSDNILGMRFGFVYNIMVSEWFYVQPGLMYNQERADYGTFNYINLPLLLSLKFPPFNINAGPYFRLWCSECYDNVFDIDLNIGLGLDFDIDKFYIGAFYNYGLVNMISGSSDFKIYNHIFGLNVGVNL